MPDYVQRFMENQGPLGPHPKHYAGGWIEVICGSMFSGKTEELIRRVKRAQIAHQKVQVFKPSIDVRYSTGQVASHNGALHSAVTVTDQQLRHRVRVDRIFSTTKGNKMKCIFRHNKFLLMITMAPAYSTVWAYS